MIIPEVKRIAEEFKKLAGELEGKELDNLDMIELLESKATEMISLIAEVVESVADTAESTTEVARTYAKVAATDGTVKMLESAIKQLKKERDELERVLADLYVEQDIQSMKVEGRTVYLSRRVRASVKSGKMAELIAALEELGYEDLVTETVNASRLTSFVKEHEEEETISVGGEDGDKYAIDEELRELINIAELTNVNVRKA